MYAGALAAGAAAGTAMLASMPEYQMGTSFVKRGGWALVHGGEEIKSAREGKVTSRMERTPSIIRRSSYYVPITIGTLHTKSDKENIVPMIKQALKEALEEKA